MNTVQTRSLAVLAGVAGLAAVVVTTSRDARAVLPPGNTVQQWNKIAEDTVVGSGALQVEGLIYMAYVSAAVYDAVTSIEGGYEPYATDIPAPPGASTEAAVIEAAYRTLLNYFPTQEATLTPLYEEALALIADGQAKEDGKTMVGLIAANAIIDLRTGDGRLTPIGTTSPFPLKPQGPGVWRLTPPAFAAGQVPWAGSVTPFVLERGDQFLPGPPPSLGSKRWVRDFNETKTYGAASGSARTDEQTAVAKFWTANVIRQYSRLLRDVADAHALDLLQTARLAAMVELVGADAGISVINAKYHYLFWRPVTAINQTAVTTDGFGPVPGFDDGNPATIEDTTWQPLLTTPNHPEYPSAHGVLTSAMAEVFRKFLGTSKVDLDIHGFDAAGSPGNLDAVRHFHKIGALPREIIEVRIWGGLHYRNSDEVGVAVGQKVARYDLGHAFKAR